MLPEQWKEYRLAYNRQSCIKLTLFLPASKRVLLRKTKSVSSYQFDSNFSLPSVYGGERAVIFDRFWGDLLQEGTHFLNPWVQWPIIFSVRIKPCRIPVIPGSKGLDLPRYRYWLQILWHSEVCYTQCRLTKASGARSQCICDQFDTELTVWLLLVQWDGDSRLSVTHLLWSASVTVWLVIFCNYFGFLKCVTYPRLTTLIQMVLWLHWDACVTNECFARK